MPNASEINSRTPVTLLTGFLGSGKSTFINSLVDRFPGLRFGVIVNEFGDIPLESEIVRAQSGDILEFSNGCLCCVARNDLLKAVRTLRRRTERIDHILVEASGLSDPVPVAQTFLQGVGRRKFELGAMVCLVDAERLVTLHEEYPIVDTQLRFADFIFVNRWEHLKAPELSRVASLLAGASPHARVSYAGADGADEPLVAIAGPDLHTLGKPLSGTVGRSLGPDHADHDRFEVFQYYHDGSVDPDRLREALDTLPAGIVRAKGIVFLHGREYRRHAFVFQLSGTRRTLEARKRKRTDKAHSVLLFIGHNLDREELARRFDSCRVQEGAYAQS